MISPLAIMSAASAVFAIQARETPPEADETDQPFGFRQNESQMI